MVRDIPKEWGNYFYFFQYPTHVCQELTHLGNQAVFPILPSMPTPPPPQICVCVLTEQFASFGGMFRDSPSFSFSSAKLHSSCFFCRPLHRRILPSPHSLVIVVLGAKRASHRRGNYTNEIRSFAHPRKRKIARREESEGEGRRSDM